MRSFVVKILVVAALSVIPLSMSGGVFHVLDGTRAPTVSIPIAFAEDKTSEFLCLSTTAGVIPTGINFPMCIAWGAFSVMQIVSLLLYLVGTIFNITITYTVVHMGANVDGLPGINSAWQVLRDFGNLLFVFALLVIGIATILRVSSYGYKTLLKSVIIGALLINFSLLFGKVIIDFSNILATGIYTQIVSTGACAPALLTTPEAIEACAKDGSSVSSRIMAELEVTNLNFSGDGLFSTTDLDAQAGALSPASKIIMISVFGTIFILVTSFVLLAAVVMLVSRYVILIFLLILSPIAFAGMALPQTKSYAKEWWSKLFSQAFFAPAYLLMMYVSLTVMSTPMISGLAADATFSDAILNLSGQGVLSASLAILLNFAVVIGLMVLSLITASKLGAYGAASSIKMGKGLALGAAGIAGAYTAGAVSSRLRKGYDRAAAYYDQQMEQAKEKSPRAYRGLQITGKALRGVAMFGTAGTSELLHQSAKAGLRRGIPGALKNAEERKYFGTTSYTEERKKDEARTKEVKGTRSQMETEQAATRIAAAVKRGDDLSSPQMQAEFTRLRSMSNAEVERLVKEEKIDGARLATIVPHLSSTQVETLLTSKDVGEADKKNIRQSRYNPAFSEATQYAAKSEELNNLDPAAPDYVTRKTTIETDLATIKARAEERIKDLSPNEIENLVISGAYTPAQLQEIAPHLSSSQWEKITKSDKLPQSFKDQLVERGRIKGFVDFVGRSSRTGVVDDADLVGLMKRTSMGDISKSVYDNILSTTTRDATGAPVGGGGTLGDKFVAELTKKHLSDMQKANKLDSSQRTLVKKVIQTLAAADPSSKAAQAVDFFSSGPGRGEW
jgi:hypothetical protein